MSGKNYLPLKKTETSTPLPEPVPAIIYEYTDKDMFGDPNAFKSIRSPYTNWVLTSSAPTRLKTVFPIIVAEQAWTIVRIKLRVDED